MKVSVAMATYNGEKYIREQLYSIIDGTKAPDEIVISDDASTDGTIAIIEEFMEEAKKRGVEVFLIRNGKNIGYVANFCKAIEKTTGDIVFLSDQDDIWEPEKLLLTSKLMEKKPLIKVLATSSTLVDAYGRTAGDYALLPEKDIETGKTLYPAVFEKPRAGWSNNNLYHRPVSERALVQIEPHEIAFHNMSQGACLAFRGNIRRDIVKVLRSDSVQDGLESGSFKSDGDATSGKELIPHDWLICLIGAGLGGFYFYNRKLLKYRIHENNAIGLGAGGDSLSLEYRSIEARNALGAVRVYLDYMENKPDEDISYFKNVEAFLIRYLNAIDNKDKLGLIKLSVSPYYKELKMLRGRVGDLVFAFKRVDSLS